jgi:hypothetical protein
VHHVIDSITALQHGELMAKICQLMKTKCMALLARHQHYMKIDFTKLGRGPSTLARQVWVANMEMTISVAKVAKGNFFTQESLCLLNTPIYLSSRYVHQHLPQMVPPQTILLQSTVIHPSSHQFRPSAMFDCQQFCTQRITPTITLQHILTTAHCPPPPYNINAH